MGSRDHSAQCDFCGCLPCRCTPAWRYAAAPPIPTIMDAVQALGEVEVAELRAKVAAMEAVTDAAENLFDNWDLSLGEWGNREEWYGDWKRTEKAIIAYRAYRSAGGE